MSFMKLFTYRKGATYTADCGKCGTTLWTQEWVHGDHNDRRDAMQAGTLRCDQCGIGTADPATFRKQRDHYAGHYSAPGYLDCTDWFYDTNLRRLEKDLRDMYGDDE